MGITRSLYSIVDETGTARVALVAAPTIWAAIRVGAVGLRERIVRHNAQNPKLVEQDVTCVAIGAVLEWDAYRMPTPGPASHRDGR